MQKSKFLAIVALPMACFLSLTAYGSSINTDNLANKAFIISVIELILFVTSLISIRQFFWRGAYNRTPFHIFNAIFVVVFYVFSLSFMVRHKSFWDGFERLSDAEVIGRFFLSTQPFAIIKKLIFVAFFLNIIYVIRYGRDYYTLE